MKKMKIVSQLSKWVHVPVSRSYNKLRVWFFETQYKIWTHYDRTLIYTTASIHTLSQNKVRKRYNKILERFEHDHSYKAVNCKLAIEFGKCAIKTVGYFYIIGRRSTDAKTARIHFGKLKLHGIIHQ